MSKQPTPPLNSFKNLTLNSAADGSRRRFVQQSAGALCFGALSPTVWAAGSDAPELKEVRIGFIPLTDCASIVMASVLGLDVKHGVKFVLSKEASWAAVRDKLVSGEIDAAHVLYGLVYGVHLGLGGAKKDMAVLMTLNQNGQAITLSQQLADKGAVNGESLAKLMLKEKREYTFAQTFPTGTHAMWLYYWMAANGIDPMKGAKVITVPPPQMVANMRVGNMDGYCVGEPWNHRAIVDKIGITATTTQDIWQDHPEKVLGTSAEFVQKNPNTARAMIMAILEAGRWIDTNAANKQKMAETIADRAYVNTSVDVIGERIAGHYQNGLGKKWDDPHHMKFYGDGAVNFPYLSDGMWFMTQHRRWGLLKQDVDYLAVAQKINQTEIYKQAAAGVKANLPKDTMRSAKLMDGQVWDGKNAAQYAASFKIKNMA
jgi:nitrate/nitrite transport system substrate-binding protein